MKKIMFNDKYGLTQAVLDGRKTMTRRMIRHRDSYEGREFGYYSYTPGTMAMSPNNNGQHFFVELLDADEFPYDTERYASSEFAVAEEVAIAQSYESMANGGYLDRMLDGPLSMKKEYAGAGYKNKMFVKPELMPHSIQITSICVEHLQDISDEDCLREGILKSEAGDIYGYVIDGLRVYSYFSPRDAFAALIDKVSGKGTWEDNPLVWVYEFKLID